jgi:hypothetical protein
MENLKKMLKISGKVYPSNWTVVSKIHDFIVGNENFEIQNKGSEELTPQSFDRRNWSLYTENRGIYFSFENDKLLLNIELINGGNRETIGSMVVPIELINDIDKDIELKFNYHCAQEYKKNKNKWIEEYKKSILK